MTKKTREWSELPFEILSLIFTTILQSRNTVRKNVPLEISQCALTCRGWRLPAQTILFSHVKIDYEIDLNIMLLRLKSRELVKSVEFNCSTDIKVDDELNLTILAHACPNLEKITFREPNNSIYRGIHALLSKDELPFLKSIPHPKHEEHAEFYLKCVSALKDRLVDLTVSCHDRGVLSDRDFGPLVYNELYDKLDQFPRLNTLGIANTYSGINCVEDFVELTIPDTNIRFETIKLYLTYSMTNNNSMVRSQRSKGREIEPLHHIKHLSLNCDNTILIGDEATILYVMKKFPNLNRLEWSNGLVFREELVAIPSVDTAVRFVNYLCNLSSCSLYSLVTDYKTIEILYQVFSAPSNYKENVLLIATRDYGNECNEMNHITCLEIIHGSKGPPNNLQRSIGVVSKATEREDGSTRYHILKKVGKYINHLRLITDPIERAEYASLSTIAKFCPNLNMLFIMNMEDRFYDTNRNTNDDGEKPNPLKTLEIHSSDYSDEKVFKSISMHFPLLESIRVEFSMDREDPTPNFTTMDMRDSRLKEIKLITRSGFVDRRKFCFMVVTLDDSRHKFFSVDLVLGSRKFDRLYGGHEIQQVTPREYQDSIESDEYSTFFIVCGSLGEIRMEYYRDTDYELVKIHCLAEFSQIV